MTALEFMYRVLVAAERGREKRALAAIGQAETDEQFAVSWQRWYFDDEEWTR